VAHRTIRFSVVESALGALLVAATERGVCNVRLGSEPAALEAGLRAEFPFAAVERDDAGLAEWTRALARLAAGRPAGLEIPLDVPASRFRRRVFEALQAIPRGETRTYAQVARAVGRPAGARAVGQACAGNPVALVIPCHRVVPAEGGVGGYRWGSERKGALLAREAGAGRALASPCRAAAAPR
jgi:AraC family transcriptional regulator of adaptative response/methylated-DNA-[protein]-cysteine methyltransferase